ncbi:MAG: hypothetical protein H7343_10155 [Undibacterium sp.]|nr:hypothetical protein [Opitutaceae bacterium]
MKPRADQSQESSIATARKSFESLSRKHPLEERGSLELPTLATPEFNLGATTALDSPKAKAMAKPSRNWLVDGVMTKPTGRELSSPSSRESGGSDVSLAKESIGGDEAGNTSLAPYSETSRDHERPAAPLRENGNSGSESFNLLASYMTGWISTQDRALLLRSKPQDTGASTWASSFVNLTAARSLSAGAGSDNPSLSQGTPKATVQVNPYLTNAGGFNAHALISDAAPSASFQNFAPVVSKPADTPARPPALAGPEQMAGKQTVRDLAKPDDNVKYFKQLKRF